MSRRDRDRDRDREGSSRVELDENDRLFDDFDEMDPEGNRLKIPDGENYEFEIERIAMVDGFRGGLTYVVEIETVYSEVDECPIGSKRVITVGGLDVKDRVANAKARIKAFLAAVIGVPGHKKAPTADSTWTQLWQDSYSEDQPLKGFVFRVAEKWTKKTGPNKEFDFPMYVFESIDGEVQEKG